MLDPRLLRTELEATAERLAQRGFVLDQARYAELEARRKALQVEAQELQNQRNVRSKGIGKAKAAGEDIQPLLAEVADLGERLKTAQEALAEVQQALQAFMLEIPNLPHPDVPAGRDDADNREERRWGEPPAFAFEPKDHVDLGARSGWMDFDAGAKLTGSRFAVMSGPLARMHRALTQFMLDIHTTEHGYTEAYVPYMVNSDSLFGTGQLPKFGEDLFHLEGTDFHLIPTAEVPLTNLVRDEIVEDADMPRRYVGHTPCFRSEAGSHGKDTRGMIRQHQFEKVELVQMVRADESHQALEALTGHAEAVLQKLELPYRVVALCTGSASKGSFVAAGSRLSRYRSSDRSRLLAIRCASVLRSVHGPARNRLFDRRAVAMGHHGQFIAHALQPLHHCRSHQSQSDKADFRFLLTGLWSRVSGCELRVSGGGSR